MAVVGGNGPSVSGTTLFSFRAPQPQLQYPFSGNTPWADIAAGSGGIGGTVNTHAFRYYRVWTSDAGGLGGFGVAEIEMAVSPSGPDTTLGQTYTSNTNFSGNPPGNAFDDNSSTEFATDFVGAQPYWIKVDYGATAGNWVAANELRIRAKGAFNQTIQDFSWQGSDDNSTWTDLFVATLASDNNWTANETRVYTATAGGATSSTGTGASTEDADTTAASGTVSIAVTGASTETADTGNGSGTANVTATGASTEGTDTTSASGTASVSASGASTEGTDTTFGAGAITARATGASTEGTDTTSAAAAASVSGTGADTEGTDNCSGSGTVAQAGSTGTGASTESDDASAGVALTLVAGTGSALEAPDTCSGTGTVLSIAFGHIKLWMGTGFIAKPVKVWNGSAWIEKPLKFWTGTVWRMTSY